MKTNKKTPIIIASLCLLALFSGCAGQNADGKAQSGKPIVAVSIVPEQTFVQKVCGDLAEVVVMVPPGFSPENYEPKPAQMEKFADASVYFTIGVPAEEQSILPGVSKNTKLISLAEDCKKEYSELEMGEEGRDPHIWLSPKRAIIMVSSIAREMGNIDPNNKSTYGANAAAYIDEIKAADEEISTELSPLKDKSFIVFHPAFGYFADDYGLTMYALEEHGKETTAVNLQKMIDLAKSKNIGVIFFQAEADGSQCQAFAEEINGKAVMLDPLSGDYTQNLKLMAAAIAEGAK